MNMVEKLAHLAAAIAEGHEREERLILQLAQAQEQIDGLKAEKKQLIDQLAKQEDMAR